MGCSVAVVFPQSTNEFIPADVILLYLEYHNWRKLMMTICIPCGYVYQGKESFESLAEEWCCPDCGASKQCFSEIDESLPEKTID